jgi:hypothetical protein
MLPDSIAPDVRRIRKETGEPAVPANEANPTVKPKDSYSSSSRSFASTL